MAPEGIKWFETLCSYAKECRRNRIIPARTDLSDLKEMECRILGGALISWLQKHNKALIHERNILTPTTGQTKNPFIVLLSDDPGLIAAREILDPMPKDLVYLYPDEFQKFIKKMPDKEYNWHCTYTFKFTAADTAESEKRAELLTSKYDILSFHFEETVMGPLFARGGKHLWGWKNGIPELIEEGFESWIS